MDSAGSYSIQYILEYSIACLANFFSPSPGMVMQLHSFLQEHPDATMEQIDNILDGNLCRYGMQYQQVSCTTFSTNHLPTRCTGYRPILDAFKKFGSNAPGAKERVDALVADIEDLGLGGDSGICKRTGKVRRKKKISNSPMFLKVDKFPTRRLARVQASVVQADLDVTQRQETR